MNKLIGIAAASVLVVVLQGCQKTSSGEQREEASHPSPARAAGAEAVHAPTEPEHTAAQQAEEVSKGWYELSATSRAMGSRFLKQCVPIDGNTVLQVKLENERNPGCRIAERRSNSGRVEHIEMFCTYTDTVYFRSQSACQSELERVTLRPADYE